METKILKIDAEKEEFTPLEEQALQEAGEIIKSGGLVAFPTETVYGLGGDGLNKESSRKIYAAKGRPSDNPLIIHIANMEALDYIVEEVTQEAQKIARAFWPGPLTMILRKSENVPEETTGGLQTVAVRMPSNKVACKLIEYGGGYIAAPSANLSGRPSPTVAKYVVEDMNGRIDMIIDGGEVGIGLESTIIDLTVTPPQILRPGYITQAMLNEVLGNVDVDKTILDDKTGQAPKAPGMKYRHYAPKGELTIVAGESPQVVDYINRMTAEMMQMGKKVGVIASLENLEKYGAEIVKSAGSREDEEAVAHNLYRILREFDDEGAEIIFSEAFADGTLGQAIMNRLLKAAGHKMVKLDNI
ncbi:MAG: threonylcarbamoyl-AMP synthase [Lachnospiraceae bacterium]|nr:threonylcarbamoyl-AMP synthase [Lachnospiraceae bacterium]